MRAEINVNCALDDSIVSLEEAELCSETVTSSGAMEEVPGAPHGQGPPVPATDPVPLTLQSQFAGL